MGSMIWDLILFWAVAVLLTLAVVGLLALAVLRARSDAPAEAHDVSVYRDQLKEVERDLARGVIGAEEADRVRLEVSRRLLEADKAAQTTGDLFATPAPASRALVLVIAVSVLLGAGGVYSMLGAPAMPDQPLKTRLADADAMRDSRPSQETFELRTARTFEPPENADPAFLELMEKLRTAVEENPDDLQGQHLLARNEAVLGNFRAAHPAMARLIALKDEEATSADWATYADLLVLSVDGYVSPEAEAAALKALELEPRNGTARYYLGLLEAQNARPDKALAIWDQLLRESTGEAPWVPPILAQIEGAAQAAGVRYSPPSFTRPDMPGPSQEDIEAVGEMEAEDRQAMIRGMVDGLAERLAEEGGSADEWARLVNALGVLGDQERAANIWAEAQDVFAAEPQGLAMIREAAIAACVAE